MSIEKHLQDLTAAIIGLTTVLQTGTIKAAGGAPVGAVPVPALAAPAAAIAAVAAPVVAVAAPALVFSDLEKRFRALVAVKRPEAVAILTQLQVGKLSLAKLEQYPQIDQLLKASGQ